MAEFESQTSIVLGPVIRPMYGPIAKTIGLEKNTFYYALMNMFTLIGELLSESRHVEIELGEFGKFQAIDRQVSYAPLNK